MPTDNCLYCKDFPGTALYLNWLIISCTCGNLIKKKEIAAIYIGETENAHVYIIAFPGCMVCGKPANIPWMVRVKCLNEEQIKLRFQEVYHNYGSRN